MTAVRVVSMVVALTLAMPAAAQTTSSADEAVPVQPSSPPGRIGDAAVGEIGQRQTREQVADELGVQPMARVAGRVQNRIQNRLRNRIDRSYDPGANATSPFAIAEDRQRSAGRPPR